MTRLLRETDQEVPRLRSRLNQFYEGFPDYFQAPSDMGHFWPHLLPLVTAICARQGRCRVLEFGAGRTGFSQALHREGMREQVEFSVHDVTAKNRAWLEEEADEVFIGAVGEIAGKYDLIFSSFVLEHMTDPEAALGHLWRCLTPGGSLALVCPRYDLPFYLPPSCDHLGRGARTWLALRISAWRIRTLLTWEPGFLLLEDLAMFHLPWIQDRDAVHLASLVDLRAFFARLGGRMARPRGRWRGGWKDWRDWFIKRHLQILLVVTVPPAVSPAPDGSPL